jgi:serine/threonine protein kinase
LKSCPRCRRGYPDDAGFCPADGSPLVQASLVPVSSTDDVRLGQRLCNRYELRRVVADGGMGRVYEAIDRETNSRVAVKVLHAEVAQDEISLERFKREYQISAALPHEHIVKVLDFQRDDAANVWLLVMEFLDGEELRVVLKREKTLPPERLTRMLAHIAIGLDEAHARQYVHRDLKPDNVFLCGTREGDHVKILDFGSVKDKNKKSKKLTMLGTTIGSPYYMAPEQAQGLESLDARADVFALAAIAYECLTGSVPFDGGNGPQILLSIMTRDPIAPTERGKGGAFPIPPAIDTVIEEALAKNANMRTRSVGELADAVGRAFGLSGNHKAWAKMPQPDLKALVDAARPSTLVGPVRLAAVDPFAASHATGPQANPFSPVPSFAPPAQGHPGASGGAMNVPAYSTGTKALDAAFEATRRAEYEGLPAGLPSRPAWLVPAIVGGVFGLLLIAAVILLR